MSNIKAKILEEVDKNAFNKFVNHSPFGDILQFWEWGEAKKTDGWRPLRVAVIEDKKILLTAQILLKKLPLLGNYAYIPHGPIFHTKQNLDKALTYFNQFLLRQSKNYNFICIEIEPRIGKLVPVEKQISKKSKSYVDKILKKKTKIDVLDTIGEFQQKLNNNTQKFSLDAKKDEDEELKIDPAELKIEKIKSLKLSNSQEKEKKKKRRYNLDFYNKPLTEKKVQKTLPNFDDAEVNQTTRSRQVEAETSSEKVEVIPESKELALQKTKKPKTAKHSLPLKSIDLEFEESLKKLQEKHSKKLKKPNLNVSTKSFQDPRIKQKAQARIKKELNSQEIMGKTSDKKKEVKEIRQEIPFLKQESPIKPLVDPEILEIFQKHGYDLTGRNMQPKHKLYYDLNLSEEELLNLCKKNTRYNIKYAKKKGVKVQEFLPDHKLIKLKIQKFYKLLLETQKRAKGYPIRSIETFFNLFKAFKKSDNLSLFEVSYNQEAIAINISQRTKYWSSSFYAGSNRKYPKLKAPYLLRWSSVMAAKKYGSKLYDFWGIIPDSQEHKGYSQQKLSFGGIRVENYGLLALPISPIKYSLWDTGIWIRTEGSKKIRETFWEIKEKLFNKK